MSRPDRATGAQRFLAALTEVTHDALFAMDAKGTVLYWGWGASNLYGHEPAQAVGRIAEDLIIAGGDVEDWRAALHECVQTGSAVRDGSRVRKDGVEVLVQSFLCWVPAHGGEPGFIVACDNDVSEARRLESELSDQVWNLTHVQQFLKSVLDASTDYSIIAVDLERKVANWNAGAQYDFGYEASIVQGRTLTPLIEPADAAGRDALEKAFESCLAQGKVETEVHLARQDRREFPARLSMTVRKDAFGAPAGFVLIVKDIAEEKRAEQERRLALERLLEIRRLNEVDKIKSTLLNTTSHELATPLTPIRIQLGVLKASQLPAPQAKAVLALERNFARLSQVVQAIGDVVSMQAGPQVECAAHDLAGVARQSVEAHAAAAQQAGLQLALVGPPELSAYFDLHRTRQILDHLVSNALRFTPGGGSVRMELGQDERMACVSVTDTGRGLTQEQMGRLFQPFSQVHDTHQMTQGGLGVGLYLARGLARAQRGDVNVASAGPGTGCTFTVELPLRA